MMDIGLNPFGIREAFGPGGRAGWTTSSRLNPFGIREAFGRCSNEEVEYFGVLIPSESGKHSDDTLLVTSTACRS